MTHLTLLASHAGAPAITLPAGPTRTTRVPNAAQHPTLSIPRASGRQTTESRSIEMYAMNEALAREHLRELHDRSRRSRAASELAAASRWHRVELRARAAHRRHVLRAERAASAVAEAGWL